MRRLFPVIDQTFPEPDGTSATTPAPAARGGPGGDREWTLDELADAYAYPSPLPRTGSGGWLRANMVTTLDGAAQHDGRSHTISSPADMRIFGVLRGLADIVMAGAETVRTEGYRPARVREAFAKRRAAAGQGPVPAIAVVTAGMDLDFSLPLFTSPLVPTLVLTGADAPPERMRAARRAGVEVVVAGEGRLVDPARAVRALVERGHTRLLTEGGPRLLGQFLSAGVLDELCLTVAPLLVAGNAQRITGGMAPAAPARFEPLSLLVEDGFVFGRYVTTGGPWISRGQG